MDSKYHLIALYNITVLRGLHNSGGSSGLPRKNLLTVRGLEFNSDKCLGIHLYVLNYEICKKRLPHAHVIPI